MEDIIGYLKMNDVEYRKNFPLSAISSVGIGGMADAVVYPKDEAELVELVRRLEEKKQKYKVVGKMSNILPPDSGYRGVVVKTDRLNQCIFDNDLITAGAGISLPALALMSAQRGLSGVEEISCIPCSLGGAIYGNAGAFGREIGELVESVRVYNPIENRIENMSMDECLFSYRKSIFKTQMRVILSATLKMKALSCEIIKENIRKYRKIRTETQPVGFPSLGSTFKRYENLSAGRLIDKCGLKGYSVGGAMVSEMHAGFIVNTGKATADDYLRLAEYVARCVYIKLGIRLEYEIENM